MTRLVVVDSLRGEEEKFRSQIPLLSCLVVLLSIVPGYYCP
jgi:hypothetical protein